VELEGPELPVLTSTSKERAVRMVRSSTPEPVSFDHFEMIAPGRLSTRGYESFVAGTRWIPGTMWVSPPQSGTAASSDLVVLCSWLVFHLAAPGLMKKEILEDVHLNPPWWVTQAGFFVAPAGSRGCQRDAVGIERTGCGVCSRVRFSKSRESRKLSSKTIIMTLCAAAE